jgi:hypothetical protein
VTAFSARGSALTAVAMAGLLSACATNSTPDAASAVGPNPLAHCQPLTDDQISGAVHADTLTGHLRAHLRTW